MREKYIFLSLVISCAVAAGATMPVESQQALVNQYCPVCHNDKMKSGGFSWKSIDLAHPDQHAEQVEKVIRKLRVGMMPPQGCRVPTPKRLRPL